MHINAATNMLFVTQQDWDRAIRNADRALTILDGLPDSRNAPNAYRDAGVFYRNVGDRLASNNAGGAASAGYWYRKSLDALLRSEKIELAWDARYRMENANRGKPGLTSLPSKLYREMGRTCMRLSDTRRALAAFERGRMLESDPDLLEDMAAAYRAAGDPRNAALALVEALAVDPSRIQLTSKLVDLYGGVDPAGCAVDRRSNPPGLNVECPLVHADICAASRNVAGTYLRRGQLFEAGAIRRVAVEELGCAPGLLN
jgi:tetratricopeptide (TPR) repeat protein